MPRGTLYQGMEKAEKSRVSMLRHYYRTHHNVELDPQRIRLVLRTKNRVKTLLAKLEPEERKLVVGMIAEKRGRRR